jgi:hypothetical protein
MSNPDEMQRKLEALETEVNQTQAPQAKTSVNPKGNPLQVLMATFDTLPTVAKVGAIAIGIVLGLAVLSMVLKIVMSIVVIAAIGIGGYLVYKFFLEAD